MKRLVILSLAFLLGVLGCTSGGSGGSTGDLSKRQSASLIVAQGTGWSIMGLDGPVPKPNSCHSVDQLPDPHCTPGAIDPMITQRNIYSTICRKGWTNTVRPPLSLTGPFKEKDLAAYGVSGQTAELDHLVPLELGGASDTRNLWPEVGSIPNPKDTVENNLRDQVCSGKLQLQVAQVEIARNWTQLQWHSTG